MTRSDNWLKLSVLLGVCLVLGGCSTLSALDDPNKHKSPDPFENVNRSIFAFNSAADKKVLRPVAKTYSNVVPRRARIGVKNFFSNLREPLNLVNNLLQGKGNSALTSGYRFVVNSTIGVLGFIDIAKLQKIEVRREDFGQTLASWGVKPGPYIQIPLLGPSNLRDGLGSLASNAVYFPNRIVTDDRAGRVGLSILNGISQRSMFLTGDQALQEQIDPYLFTKTVFEDIRIKAIYDGSPPGVDDIDDF